MTGIELLDNDRTVLLKKLEALKLTITYELSTREYASQYTELLVRSEDVVWLVK